MFTWWKPRPNTLVLGVPKPRHISSDDGYESCLGMPNVMQQNGCVDIALELCLGHLLPYRLLQLGHKAKCREVLYLSLL